MVTWTVPITHLRRLLELISEVVGYSFDDIDYIAIDHACLQMTSSRSGLYEYTIYGQSELNLTISYGGEGCFGVTTKDARGHAQALRRIEFHTDEEIIEQAVELFRAAPRPVNFTNIDHCEECAYAHRQLSSLSPSVSTLETAGSGYGGMNFALPEAFRYLFPCFVRDFLTGKWVDCPTFGVSEHLWHMNSKDIRYAIFAHSERQFIARFLRYAYYWQWDRFDWGSRRVLTGVLLEWDVYFEADFRCVVPPLI